MNKPESPVRTAKPPISPEELAEVMRRTETEYMAAQEAAARPGPEVMAELLKKHTGPG